MNEVILYGVGETFRCFEKMFREFQNRSKVRVIGVADKSLRGGDKTSFHDFKVLSLKEVVNMNADYVIITAQEEAAKGIYSDLCSAGVQREKIVDFKNYPLVEEELNRIDREQLPVQLEIIRKILSASDRDVESFAWMRDIVGQYGIYPYLPGDWSRTDNVVGTRKGILQRPDEFTEYCVYLSEWHIDTAIEVGVFRGKSSYFMCALLARRNPNLVYELVDINDSLDDFDEFHKLLPQMHKRIPSTSDDYIGKSYDFVFIDADHSYDASMRDYMNLGRYTKKITAFHDIYAHEYDHLNGGTVRMWQEVVDMTPQLRHHVFSECPGQWMGLGVLEHER